MFFAPKGGMGVLVDALVRSLGDAGVELRTDALAVAVDRDGGVRLDGGELVAADGVVVAVPAAAAAMVLGDLSAEATGGSGDDPHRVGRAGHASRSHVTTSPMRSTAAATSCRASRARC